MEFEHKQKQQPIKEKHEVNTCDIRQSNVGKYALENGNEIARRHFSSVFPNISENTIRNFKKKNCNKRESNNQSSRFQLSPPPLLLDLDEKLIKYLRAI